MRNDVVVKPQVKKGYSSGMAVYETYSDDTQTALKPFGHALIELAQARTEIVGLTADLGKYTDLDIFGAAFPARYFQIGMAEQNLLGVAAGLAKMGFTPFATGYCSFLTRRAYDFLAIAIAEQRANVKVIAALPGLTTSYGATHQGIEDLALMRAIPGLTVIDPCDATEIEMATRAVADFDGPVYLRMLRGRVKRLFDAVTHKFEIGKAQLLRTGNDVAFISTGVMTDRALQAADALAVDGLHAAVLHVPTLKPLDVEAIVNVAAQTRAVVTMENHTLIGGLGAAVSEALYDARLLVPLQKIGIPDRYLECGSVPYLTDKYALAVRHAVAAARQVLPSAPSLNGTSRKL